MIGFQGDIVREESNDVCGCSGCNDIHYLEKYKKASNRFKLNDSKSV